VGRLTGAGILLAAAAAIGGVWLALPRGAPIVVPLPAEMDRLDPQVAAMYSTLAAQVHRRPDDAESWRQLALAYYANEQTDLAKTCAGHAVRLDPSSARAWHQLALIEDLLGDLAAAQAALDEALRRRTDFAPLHWQLGRACLRRGDLPRAEATFREAIRIDPGDPAGPFGLARVELLQGRHDSAIALLEPLAASSGPFAPYASQLLGTAYRRAGRLAEAEAAWARGVSGEAVWLDPWELEAMAYRPGFSSQMSHAQSLAAAGRLGEAIDVLSSLVRQRPDDANVLNNLATALRMDARIAECRALLDRALAQHPEFYPMRFNLAMLLEQQAQSMTPTPAAADRLRLEALQHLDLALRINPSYAPALGLRGDLLRARGSLADATASYQLAARADPSNANWLLQAAEVELDLLRPEEAATLLRRVTAQAPMDPRGFKALAEACRRLGRAEEEQAALRRLAQLRPSTP
jgi:tetratricopeptide (TPR) repeat protein